MMDGLMEIISGSVMETVLVKVSKTEVPTYPAEV
jgi:hypothetical protein